MMDGIETIPAALGSHVVHFYADETELAQTLGRYVSDAEADGAVTVVIATEAHRRALETELAQAGIDPVEGVRDGRLILLDAAATMSMFITDGRIDRVAFRRVIGSLLEQIAQTGQPLRAYGEMVALLWEAGDVLAAIELEELWNELGRELEFALLCGYHGASVEGEEHGAAVQQICQLHSSVIHGAASRAANHTPVSAGTEAKAQFAAAPDAPRRARHFVAGVLREWGYGGVFLDDAQLIVTELATNAVIHAGSAFSVVVRAGEDGARISVADGSCRRPQVRPADPLATSGRGLRLIAALTDHWDADINPDGKTVWAELHPGA
jgi:anti-sigma regulatory factor (Ser/Thr protein kinase)